MDKADVFHKQIEVKEPWKDVLYFLIVQKEAMKASHQKLFRKIKLAKLH